LRLFAEKYAVDHHQGLHLVFQRTGSLALARPSRTGPGAASIHSGTAGRPPTPPPLPHTHTTPPHPPPTRGAR
jgi:hypothetical protein